MPEPKPNPEPQGGGAPGEGGGNGGGQPQASGQEEIVRLINAQTGRQFKSLADVSNSIKEASSLVTSRKAVEAFAKANNMGFDDALTFLQDYESGGGGEGGKPKPQPGAAPQTDPDVLKRLTHVERTLAENDFLRANPDYTPHMDFIRAFAESKGGNPFEAVKDEKFKSALDLLVAKDKETKAGKESILESGPRVAPTSPEYQAAFAEARKTGNWATVLRLKGVLSGT